MPSDLPRLPLRLEEDAKVKLEYIAYRHGRSANKEIGNLLLRYIDQFEKKHGLIDVSCYCDYLNRPVACDNGICFLKAKCKNDCQQCGGSSVYLRKR